MNIQADKFLALTALLAGFVPTTACTLNITGNSATDSAGTETSTDPGSGGSTQGSEGTTQGGTTGATDGMTSAPTSGMTSTGEAPTSGTTAGTSADSTGGTTGGAVNDCCEPHRTAGCSDEGIQDCVCAVDPLCCGFEGGFWDEVCVQEVNENGCGMCDLGGTTTE